MDKRLTIGICTRDRSCLGLCLRRLSVLPKIETIDVIVADNSTYDSYVKANRECTEGYGFKFFHTKEFMDARNDAIAMSVTEYFMWLDDDDYLSVDSIVVIEKLIEDTGADFISLGVNKEGRIQSYDHKIKDISSIKDRYKYLNQFDHYAKDRDTKVYLWNCAIVFKKDLAVRCAFWKYVGCDDILPITDMYINALKVIRANIPIYYYKVQTFVTSEKSADQIKELAQNMYFSYSKLLEINTRRDKWFCKIMKRAIQNSIRQLEVNDGLTDGPLIQLKCSF